MYNLKGKVALVTGAAGKRGMGRATALCLAEEGADVVVSDVSAFDLRGRTEDDRMEGWQGLRDVEAEIRALGRKALSIEVDISSNQQVEEMVAKCIAEFGKIDILVNNAGITGQHDVPALGITEEDWYRVLSVNLMGPYWCAKAVAKRMIEKGQGGKIINIASMNGKIYFKPADRSGLVPYTVSKFGVVGLTQVLAAELAQYKIYVNAICPGLIATEIRMGASIRGDVRRGMTLEEATSKAYAQSLPQIPLGGLASRKISRRSWLF